MLVPWPSLMSITLGTCNVPSNSEIYLGSDVANSWRSPSTGFQMLVPWPRYISLILGTWTVPSVREIYLNSGVCIINPEENYDHIYPIDGTPSTPKPSLLVKSTHLLEMFIVV